MRAATRPLRLLVAGTAAAALAATALLVPPAASADVFEPGSTGVTADVSTFVDQDCGSAPDEDTDLQQPVENGPRSRSTVSSAGTLSRSGETPEQESFSTRLTGSSLLRSEGDLPRRVSLKASGSIDTGPLFADCGAQTYLELNLASRFSVPATTVVTLSADTVGIDGGVEVQRLASEPDADGFREEVGVPVRLRLEYLSTRGTVRVELEPGWWDLRFESSLSSYQVAQADGTMTVDAAFAVPGERQRLSGAGRRFVTMPEQRDCEAGTVTPGVTTDAADASAVRRVELSVDGRRAAAVRRPDAGQSFPLALRRGAPATVRALVVLDPVKPGAPTRQRTVTATYGGCGH